MQTSFGTQNVERPLLTPNGSIDTTSPNGQDLPAGEG